MAEPIKMQFGGLICVDPRNHVLDGVIPLREGQFWGLSSPLESIGHLCCGICGKRDHSISSFKKNKTETGMKRKIQSSVTSRRDVASY